MALATTACQKEARKDAAEASPDAKPGAVISDGRLVLPAVKGNPGAAYFTLANNGNKPVKVSVVDVAGAGMAMLHETMAMDGHSSMGEIKEPEIKPGEAVKFAPGAKHVMVSDLPSGLAPGSTVEMTITFADGDKISTPLSVRGPGDAN
jgi:copper(I)-binding protein